MIEKSKSGCCCQGNCGGDLEPWAFRRLVDVVERLVDWGEAHLRHECVRSPRPPVSFDEGLHWEAKAALVAAKGLVIGKADCETKALKKSEPRKSRYEKFATLQVATVEQMIRGLRSGDHRERRKIAVLLDLSIAARLRVSGQNASEFIVALDRNQSNSPLTLSQLLNRAANGDFAATDCLQSVLTISTPIEAENADAAKEMMWTLSASQAATNKEADTGDDAETRVREEVCRVYELAQKACDGACLELSAAGSDQALLGMKLAGVWRMVRARRAIREVMDVMGVPRT